MKCIQLYLFKHVHRYHVMVKWHVFLAKCYDLTLRCGVITVNIIIGVAVDIKSLHKTCSIDEELQTEELEGNFEVYAYIASARM